MYNNRLPYKKVNGVITEFGHINNNENENRRAGN